MFPESLIHFDRYEFVNPDNMDEQFLKLLDLFRDHLGIILKVTGSNEQTGHSKNSFHYLGLAIDGDALMNPLDFFIKASMFRFTGLGLYFIMDGDEVVDWYFHIDLRKKSIYEPSVYWIATLSIEDARRGDFSKNVYDYNVTAEKLMRYCMSSL